MKLDELSKKEAEEFTEFTAQSHGIPYANLMTDPIDTDALRLIPESKARKAESAPFSLIDKRVRLASIKPLGEGAKEIKDDLGMRGYDVEIFAASPQGIERAFSKYKELSYAFETKAGALDISNEEITNLIKEVKGSEDIKKKIKAVSTN